MADSLIAGIALVHNATLLTRNRKHFERVAGLRLVSMTPTSTPMTLPAKYYTDPEIFRSEMERFYFGRWIYAGRAERIAKPGDYFLCNVAGESVIVTRERRFLQCLPPSRHAHV